MARTKQDARRDPKSGPPPKKSPGPQTKETDAQREVWKKQSEDLNKKIRESSGFKESLAKAQARLQQGPETRRVGPMADIDAGKSAQASQAR